VGLGAGAAVAVGRGAGAIDGAIPVGFVVAVGAVAPGAALLAPGELVAVAVAAAAPGVAVPVAAAPAPGAAMPSLGAAALGSASSAAAAGVPAGSSSVAAGAGLGASAAGVAGAGAVTTGSGTTGGGAGAGAGPVLPRKYMTAANTPRITANTQAALRFESADSPVLLLTTVVGGRGRAGVLVPLSPRLFTVLALGSTFLPLDSTFLALGSALTETAGVRAAALADTVAAMTSVLERAAFAAFLFAPDSAGISRVPLFSPLLFASLASVGLLASDAGRAGSDAKMCSPDWP
jgi:hypothetical protein